MDDVRVRDIMGNELEATEILAQLDDLVEKVEKYEKIFPLQTQQSMAERWGVSKQVVSNWTKRHDDFPQELDGLIAKTGKTPKLYAMCDVERYERARRLN